MLLQPSPLICPHLPDSQMTLPAHRPSTDLSRTFKSCHASGWLAAVFLACMPVMAQTGFTSKGDAASEPFKLSSPMPGVAPATPGSGEGAGVHSPLSTYKPLKARDDVVSWQVLTDVKTVIAKRKINVEFGATVRALDGKTIRVQGFMMPLDPGKRQKRFLVVSVPPSCPFCTPGGPESMLDIRPVKPVNYQDDAIVVEGRLEILGNDHDGFYYRLHEARPVP